MGGRSEQFDLPRWSGIPGTSGEEAIEASSVAEYGPEFADWSRAEPGAAPDRGGIYRIQGSTSHRPPRQVSLVVSLS